MKRHAFGGLAQQGLGQKGKKCKGGLKCKQRVTVTFIVNVAGNKETPIVIWQSEKPQVFSRYG